jgi:hypothetical protein
MKFITTPFVFLVAALILIGVVHDDLWIAFSRFSTLGGEAKAGCLFAAFAGLFAALLRDESLRSGRSWLGSLVNP